MDRKHRPALWLVSGFAILALIAAVVFLWQGNERDQDMQRGGALQSAEAEHPSAPAVAGDASETAGSDDDRVIIEPRDSAAGESAPEASGNGCLKARFVNPDGVPIAGVEVSIRPKVPSGPTISDLNGRIEVAIPFDDGAGDPVRYFLVFRHSHCANESKGLKVGRGETADLGDIVLKPGGTVSGRVTDTFGRPVDGATVTCTHPELHPSEEESAKLEGPMFREEFLFTKTNGNGVYRMSGIEVGGVRVWAGADGMYHSWSEPVEVLTGQESTGVDLVLEPMPEELFIAGIVLDPEGKPVPRTDVNLRFEIDGHNRGFGYQTDEEGRFRHVARKSVPHKVTAGKSSERFWPVTVEDVQPGTTDLVLRLTPRAELRLLVRGSKGETVESFSVKIGQREQDFFFDRRTLRFDKDDLAEDGTVRISEPGAGESLEIDAPGFEGRELGPFDLGSRPEFLEAILVAVPAVTGRVAAEGLPVKGAQVALCEAILSGQTYSVKDLPCRSKRTRAAEAVTDEDGRFDLWPKKSGTYYLRASKNGFAPGELGPLEIDMRSGAEDLDVAVSRGGSIEGRVLVNPDESQAGILVIASRGDGYPASVKTDAEGYYRFDMLTPGTWHVEARPGEDDGGMSTSFSSGSRDDDSPPEIPWVCIVEEGKVTRYDVDMTSANRCVLDGVLTIDGMLPGLWWEASLARVGSGKVPLHDGDAQTELEPDGSLTLAVDDPGTYRLALQGMIGKMREAWVEDRVELVAGVTLWRCELTTGKLEIRGGLPAGGRLLTYEQAGEGHLNVAVRIKPDANGCDTLPAVPAGKGKIVLLGSPGEGDPAAETVLAEVEVPAGGTATVTIE